MSVATPRIRLVGLLQAAAFATALFSLATIADQLHRLFELFSHFRLQYLLVSVLLAIVFIALRQRNWSSLMLAVAAINLWTVAPWYLGDGTAIAAPRESITILHANVQTKNRDAARVLDWIEDVQPDIVFLQEVNERWLTSLDRLHTNYPYRHAAPRDDNFGIAVFARQPLQRVTQHDGPPLGLPSLIVETRLDGQPIRFVSTHPIPPIGKSGFDARNAQLADIASIIAATQPPVVLIGDLNTSMWSHHYEKFIAATGLKNARSGAGVMPTWPTFLPFAMIPIDHCLVSNDVIVLAIETGPDIGSDHLPLITELAL